MQLRRRIDRVFPPLDAGKLQMDIGLLERLDSRRKGGKNGRWHQFERGPNLGLVSALPSWTPLGRSCCGDSAAKKGGNFLECGSRREEVKNASRKQ